MVKNALVSLWRRKDSTAPADFACSGFFVAPRHILTAGHVLENVPVLDDKLQLWARCEVAATSSYQLALIAAHETLDVVLLQIDAMPAEATSLSPDLDSSRRTELHLYGYFRGDREEKQRAHALTFDDRNKQYRLDIKQPEGHSGSPLCAGVHVWAMAIRHYKDANIHRGCALGVHQFWPWLSGLLPDLAKSAVQPPPQWTEWVERGRSTMAKSFRSAVFDRFEPVFPRDGDGLPEAIGAALTNPEQATVGKNCVDALIDLFKSCHAAVLDGSVTLAANERKAAHIGFLSAMGSAARLCLDPAQLHAYGIDPNGKLPSILMVPAFTVPGAGLALRPAPQHSWVLGEENGLPAVQDCHAVELPVELGEGDNRRQSLAAAAFRCIAGLVKMPACIDDAICRKIRARAISEAREGRARLLVAGSQWKSADRDELQVWAAENLGINLLILDSPDGAAAGLFLSEEEPLLARIYEFMDLLRKSEWNPT
ncbi:MAG: serine protease [Candidatus Accumulibacter sp. UW25]|jgi:hypothetical protein